MALEVIEKTIEQTVPLTGSNETGESPASKVSSGRAGINVCGYLRTESGVGAGARSYIRALQHLDVPLALADVSIVSGNRAEDQTIGQFDSEYPHDVNLVCGDVELYFAIRSRLGEDFFNDRYNIGIWWWELPEFPQKWYGRFAYFDEIWVATSFVANALSPISPIPIVRIPPVLAPHSPGSRDAGRDRLGVSGHEWVYLFIFDFHSHIQRKNPLAIIDAFKLAFAPSDPVQLVIKCVNAESNQEGFAQLSHHATGHRIAIYNGYWPQEEVRDLKAACDIYISLHRSEGAGLTITDAMALGKPVIATGWSGNMDFMNVSNSFPVRYELVELQQNVGPYRKGQVWAEPSIEHAAEMMRLVFDDRAQAQSIGEAARRDIEAHYSEETVARMIARRLDTIAIRRRFDAFVQEMKAEYTVYRQSFDRIRDAVHQDVPGGAIIAVVSKGDGELLELGGRQAWHFPQQDDGIYAGYYPTDSTAAIEHLEALRVKGASFLLFPATAFWWLEFYADFAQHLDARYQRIRDDQICIIYRLSSQTTAAHANQVVVNLELLSDQIYSLSTLEAAVRAKLLITQERLSQQEKQIDTIIRSLRNIPPPSAVPEAPSTEATTIMNLPVAPPTAYEGGMTILDAGRSVDASPIAQQWAYRNTIAQIRQIVGAKVPAGAVVIVVSKGDDELLKFDGQKGWHFPQQDDGVYTGYYPADSADAIRRLEVLQARGGEFLLFPRTAFWWLGYYTDLRRHLDANAKCIYEGEHCTIYSLSHQVTTEELPQSLWQRLGQMLWHSTSQANAKNGEKQA